MFKIFFQLAKNKLKKFAELKTLAHVIEPPIDDPNKSFDLKGQWSSDFFKNENPITLELGCGRGEYTVALAKKFPQKNKPHNSLFKTKTTYTFSSTNPVHRLIYPTNFSPKLSLTRHSLETGSFIGITTTISSFLSFFCCNN